MLIINGLTIKYNSSVIALNNINLQLSQSGVIGILGPNGAGKSTLLRILATVQIPDKGNVFYNEINLLKDKMRIRKILGYLPQEFGFPSNVTPCNYLKFVAEIKLNDKKQINSEVHNVLRHTNLEDVQNEKIGNLSFGTKQRLGIAQSIIGKPELLIIDEPTSGLDPAERLAFLETINKISNNCMVLFSTHIVEDIESLCRFFFILDNGNIIFNGNIENAFDILKNKLWIKKIDGKEINSIPNILSKEMKYGKIYVTVYSDKKPEGFISKEPTIKDFYLFSIKHNRKK